VHELIWAQSGLRSAALTLRIADQSAAAEEIARFADDLRAPVGEALIDASRSVGTALAALCALVESDSIFAEAGSDHLARLLPLVLDASVNGAVWHRVGSAGMSPRLSVALGGARARAGDVDAVLGLRWMLDVGEPTWSWPEFVHPRTGDGCGGDGHAPTSTAALLRLVRHLTVLEDEGGLDILPVVPLDWLGQPIEVHDLPTRHGRLSFAVRWHGERPAVLWELVGHTDPAVAAEMGGTPVRLRFGGLDPAWSSADARGEALLAVPMSAGDIDGADGGVGAAVVSEDTANGSASDPVVIPVRRRPESASEGGSFS
jgi:hypothetical protein